MLTIFIIYILSLELKLATMIRYLRAWMLLITCRHLPNQPSNMLDNNWSIGCTRIPWWILVPDSKKDTSCHHVLLRFSLQKPCTVPSVPISAMGESPFPGTLASSCISFICERWTLLAWRTPKRRTGTPKRFFQQKDMTRKHKWYIQVTIKHHLFKRHPRSQEQS